MSNSQFLIRENLLNLFTENPTLNNISNTRLIFEYLNKRYEVFRPDKKEVIESRLNQSKEILESVKD